MHPQAQGTETQSVIIAYKELSKMRTKKESCRFLTFVLLGQLFYNENKHPVVVRVKNDELIEPAAK